jgi:hypothetical protein
MRIAMLAAAVAVASACAGLARADAPTPVFRGTGVLSWFGYGGLGACGEQLDPAAEELASVPSQYWTTANPNDDPLCAMSVQVGYGATTIVVPVLDKCRGCAADQLELSRRAFALLAPLDRGVLRHASWRIVAP